MYYVTTANIGAGWQVSQHSKAPEHVRRVVMVMLTLRLVPHEPASILCLIPNELMFQIFWYLPWIRYRR
jgi:hypothetical protein